MVKLVYADYCEILKINEKSFKKMDPFKHFFGGSCFSNISCSDTLGSIVKDCGGS